MTDIQLQEDRRFFDLIVTADRYVSHDWTAKELVKGISLLKLGKYLFRRNTVDWLVQNLKERNEVNQVSFTPTQKEIFMHLVGGC